MSLLTQIKMTFLMPAAFLWLLKKLWYPGTDFQSVQFKLGGEDCWELLPRAQGLGTQTVAAVRIPNQSFKLNGCWLCCYIYFLTYKAWQPVSIIGNISIFKHFKMSEYGPRVLVYPIIGWLLQHTVHVIDLILSGPFCHSLGLKQNLLLWLFDLVWAPSSGQAMLSHDSV